MSTLRDDALRTAVVPAHRSTARRRLPVPRPQRPGTPPEDRRRAATPLPAAPTTRAAARDRAPQRPSALLDAYCVLLGAVVLAGSLVGEAVSAPLRGRRRDDRRPV